MKQIKGVTTRDVYIRAESYARYAERALVPFLVTAARQHVVALANDLIYDQMEDGQRVVRAGYWQSRDIWRVLCSDGAGHSEKIIRGMQVVAALNPKGDNHDEGWIINGTLERGPIRPSLGFQKAFNAFLAYQVERKLSGKDTRWTKTPRGGDFGKGYKFGISGWKDNFLTGMKGY